MEQETKLTTQQIKQLGVRLARINAVCGDVERLRNKDTAIGDKYHFELTEALGALQHAASQVEMIITRNKYEGK